VDWLAGQPDTLPTGVQGDTSATLHLQDAGPHRREPGDHQLLPDVAPPVHVGADRTSTDQTGVAWFGIDGEPDPVQDRWGLSPTRTWCTTMVAPGSTSEGR